MNNHNSFFTKIQLSFFIIQKIWIWLQTCGRRDTETRVTDTEKWRAAILTFSCCLDERLSIGVHCRPLPPPPGTVGAQSDRSWLSWLCDSVWQTVCLWVPVDIQFHNANEFFHSTHTSCLPVYTTETSCPRNPRLTSLSKVNMEQYSIQRNKTSLQKVRVRAIIQKCVRWWGSSSGNLGNLEYPFLAITPGPLSPV